MVDYRDMSTHDRRHSRALRSGPSPTFLLVLEALTLGLLLAVLMGPWPR